MTIHLLFPLTKESVSTNNHNGRNYGSDNGGTIETIHSFWFNHKKNTAEAATKVTDVQYIYNNKTNTNIKRNI